MPDMSDRPHPSDELIARALVGALTPGEEESLRTWLEASPENEARYEEMVRLATLAAQLPANLGAGPPPTVVDLKRRTASRRRRGGPAAPVWGRSRVVWWMAAAAILVVALGTTLLVRATGMAVPEGSASEVEAFATGPSDPSTVTFRDGTVVRLAPDSRLGVHEFRTERRVSLTGRAYFAVATDPDGRLLIIDTPAGEVRVLGTRFDVMTRAENLEVVVVEGRVALSSHGVETEVRGGQVGRVVNGKTLPAVDVENPHERIDWVGRFLAFHSTPLAAAAREIERQYGVQVRITDPSLAERTITTWFSGWELEDVMTVFCTIAEAHCSTDGDVIRVAPVRPNDT
jgi:ferric-dicitrate binding protein FerR (iron transport regulator)